MLQCRKLFRLLTVIWVCFIFYNSSDIAQVSNDKSLEIAQELSSHLTSTKDPVDQPDKSMSINKINHFVRKSAHAFEFFILTILVFLSFGNLKSISMERVATILFIVLICAVFDEFYQNFIPGRTSSVKDVLIDFFGGCFAMSGIYLCSYWIPKQNKTS
ncbi:MAG: VanZ family protein [Turicibacter sp.]